MIVVFGLAIVIIVAGFVAPMILVGRLRQHYPSIYASLGQPTAWGYFMDARAGWFARKNVKNYQRFIFDRQFENLDRTDVRMLGYLSLAGVPIGLLVGAIAFMLDKL